MKNSTKQVVILDNFSSPYIYQAILILKDYDPLLEDKIIEEAEAIVSKYLNKQQAKPKKQSKFPIFVLSAIAFALCFIIISRFI